MLASWYSQDLPNAGDQLRLVVAQKTLPLLAHQQFKVLRHALPLKVCGRDDPVTSNVSPDGDACRHLGDMGGEMSATFASDWLAMQR